MLWPIQRMQDNCLLEFQKTLASQESGELLEVPQSQRIYTFHPLEHLLKSMQF